MWRFLSHYSRILFVSGLVGLIFFFYFFGSLPITDNREIIHNKFDALKIATSELSSLGYSLENYKIEYAYYADNTTRWYLTRLLGAELAQNQFQRRVAANDAWHFRFSQNLPRDAPQESFEVRIAPTGHVLAWIHKIPDEAPGKEISEEMATFIANQFLQKKQWFNLTQFKIETSSTSKKNRVDYVIDYIRPDSLLQGDWRLQVILHGDKVEGFSHRFVIPQEMAGLFQTQMNIKNRFHDLVAPIFMLIFLWLIIEFIRLYHAGEIGEKNGLYLLILVAVVLIAGTLNELISNAYGWHINVKSRSQVQFTVATQTIFTEDIILSLIVFFAFMVGESIYRAKNQTAKLTSCDALFTHKWLNINVAQSMSQGFFAAGILLGLTTGIILIFKHFFGVIIDQNLFVEPLDKHFPWLTPLLESLIFTFSGAIVLLFFLSTIIHKYTKNKILSVLPFILISICTTYMNISFYPYYWDIIFVFAVGAGFIFIFFKYDLLTTVITFFVYGTMILAYPLLQTNNSFLVLSGLSGTIVGLTPLFVALLGFKSNQFFQIPEKEIPTYIKRITERERMARELEIARNIQMGLLPQKTPKMGTFDISAICVPAREVGGDYFDFTRLNNHQFGFSIGDVSGKGLPAAIYMTLTKGIFLSYSEEVVSPKTVLMKVNRLLYRIMERGHFVSMFYGVFDVTERSLSFARAGHNPGIWYSGENGHIHLLEPDGMALGLDAGDRFNTVLTEEKIVLNQGDTLVFYTDGFSEARNENWEELGEARLATVLRQNTHFSAKQMLNNVITEIRRFTHNQAQQDDMTMVVVKIL